MDRPKSMQPSPEPMKYTTLADQRMLTTALTKWRWEIPEVVKINAMNCIRTILDPESNAKQSLQLQAIKNLAMLDKLNLDEEKMHEPIKHIHVNVDALTQHDLENEIQELIDARSRNNGNNGIVGRIKEAI